MIYQSNQIGSDYELLITCLKFIAYDSRFEIQIKDVYN